MTILTAWRTWLDNIYPGLWNLALSLVVVALLWGLKKWQPDFFAKLPPSVQALPAMFLAGVASAFAAFEPTLISFLTSLIGGAITGGVAAVGAHHVLKESKLPYGNEPQKPLSARRVTISGIALVLLLVVSACNPGDAKTAFDIADDVLQVAKVLCLADHANMQNVRAITVKDLCATEQQIAPYLPAAKAPTMLASRGACP